MSEKSVFCCNCFGEYILSDLGVYLDEETNGLSHFCPSCGWTEFLTENDPIIDSKEAEKVLEDGPKQYYPYPKNVVRHTPHTFLINDHDKILQSQ